jgi:two-component system cell cycle response regulator
MLGNLSAALLSARFYLCRPLPISPLNETQGEDKGMASILIIDDNEDILLVTARLLARRGYTPVTARSGAAGLALAQQTPPDLILCDIWMPEMNGYEVIARLKRDPRLCRIPVAALTAIGDGDKARTLAAGFDAYISKPIMGKTFAEAIEALVPRAQAVHYV